MSTVATTYLKDRATAAQLLTTSVIKGAVKMYGSVGQAGTQALASGFNVASITDTGAPSWAANSADLAIYANDHVTLVDSWANILYCGDLA